MMWHNFSLLRAHHFIAMMSTSVPKPKTLPQCDKHINLNMAAVLCLAFSVATTTPVAILN
jgi:hypothetical protein